METKVCSKCAQEKPVNDFYRTKTGYESECKVCSDKRHYDRRIARRVAAGQPVKTLTTRQSRELLEKGLKLCPRCLRIKSVDDFHKYAKSASGRACHCIQCARELSDLQRQKPGAKDRAKKSYQQNKRDQRNKRLLSKFGITIDDYNRKFQEQNGLCAICGASPLDNGKALAVDHCHDTAAVRGLLCNNCNAAIGFLMNDPVRCLRAKEYLERYSGIYAHPKSL